MWPGFLHKTFSRRARNREDATGLAGKDVSATSEKMDVVYQPVDRHTSDDAKRNVKEGETTLDLETGPQYERLILSVRGMTCSGCRNGLERAIIQAIPSARNIKSSAVTARVEFEVNTGLTSVQEVLDTLHNSTKFQFVRVEEAEGRSIEVGVYDASTFCRQSPPHGVLEMTPVTHDVVKLRFDPSVIGTRQLVERSFPQQLILRPVDPDPTVSFARQNLWRDACLVALAASLTCPVLVLTWSPILKSTLTRSIDLALATVIQLGVVWEFVPRAFVALVRSKSLEVDALIVLSTTTAYLFSVVIFVFGILRRPIYEDDFFASSTLLVTLILVGRFISNLARQRSIESVSVRSLQCQNVTIYTDRDRRQTRNIDLRLLEYGDIIRVPPESRIATDGTVIFGGSEVDESMITGEPQPVAKAIDSRVIAGSLNKSSTLDVLVSKLSHENTISLTAELVDNAGLTRPRSQAISDRFAGYFVPAILLLAIMVFVIQFVVRYFGNNQSVRDAIVSATTFAIAALIVSCPCAIGLAVPMVIVIASGMSAKRGVVFKDPQMLEEARKVTHVVLDKTGTLTDDNMEVLTQRLFPMSQLKLEKLKALIRELLADVRHPVSVGVVNHLRETKASGMQKLCQEIKTIPGKGVEGKYLDMPIRAGNPNWLGVSNLPSVTSIKQNGPELTILCVVWKSRILAVFGLSNKLRPDALPVIKTLLSRNIKVSIVSGDDSSAVQAVASKLGIDAANTRSCCSPQEKYDFIQCLHHDQPGAVVMFCGDGTNDAPALKAAQIGVHMASSSGTDIARAAAAVVLVRPELKGILVALDISKASYARIVCNFAWCVIYNVVALSMAAGAWIAVKMPPQYAALGELISVLPVIIVAWSLTWCSTYGRLQNV